MHTCRHKMPKYQDFINKSLLLICISVLFLHLSFFLNGLFLKPCFYISRCSILSLLLTIQSMASSSQIWKYDVFLSFRGPDTRKGITSELYDRLQKRGIRTFMDEQDLEVGDVISPTLLRAIEDSTFAIVVLSQNYASSPWCLEELTKICQCMEDNNRILPLFYHVDPSDVRYQKRSFEDAFMKHKNAGRYGNKEQQWRDALNKVANFSGWHTLNYNTERQLVEVIVENVCSKVRPIEIEFIEDFEVFEATKKTEVKVMTALTDDKVTAIGVYGMGGVGKTSLVKYIGQLAQARGLFEQVVMVVVSQTPDVRKIQDTLADGIGLKLEKESVEGRAHELKLHILLRRSKILFLLDDIWERLDLPSIGIPSYKKLQNCSSKVILTTRRLNVCHVMNCREKISLSILSTKDSWSLFKTSARVSFDSAKFEEVAKRVSEECKGLPIALITVARALGDKDIKEWESAIRRLEKSQVVNPDDEGHAFQCIKLSYDYLRDKDCRSYFLLCCLFPEDDNIEIEVLLRYAIGKGLFSDAESTQESREAADSVVKHLKNSSLLLYNEEVGCVRMHDVIRDTAIQIARDDHGFWVRAGCGVDTWPRGIPEGCSAISLMGHCIDELPKQLVFPKLEFLCLNPRFSLEKGGEKEIPESFFQIPNKLRVLDLSGYIVSSLPQSLSLLNSLRTLRLDSCKDISNFSLVGKLEKLEILSMRSCQIKELPREIGDLTNLRILDVTWGLIETVPSGVISRLRKLEELYLQCKFYNWGSKVAGQSDERNAGFDEVTSLSNLRHLKVCISRAECIPENVEFIPNWVSFNIWLGHLYEGELEIFVSYENSRSLRLATSIATIPDWFANEVLSKADSLQYWASNEESNLIDLFEEYNRGRLHGLKDLTVNSYYWREPKTAKTWVPKEAVFENLEDLNLYYLRRWEVLLLSDLPHGSLINLKKLYLAYSDCSVVLPPKLLHRLPNLEKLACSKTADVEYVFECKGSEIPESKLRDLRLTDLRAMRSICDGPSPPAIFRTLESVTLISCNIRGSLFTSDIVDCLFQLNAISLRHCPFLERITEAAINKKTTVPKLKKLELDALPMLIGTIDFECPSLEELRVFDCPKFSFSVSDLHSKKQVQVHLEERPWWG